MQNPLNKVVFIQKVTAFTNTDSPKDLLRLAYVSNSWNDTIKNYSFHIFEKRVSNVESIDTQEAGFVALIWCDVTWFVEVLMFSETVINRYNLPRLVCAHTSSVAMMRLLCEKIVEVGGNNLLKSQLTAANTDGLTCLMFGCGNSSSPDVVELVFEKIMEVGGKDLLKSELTATPKINNMTCLMLCCLNSYSPEILKLIVEKIIEAGGPELLKSQLTATNEYGQTCLMLSCGNSSSPEVLTLLAVVLFSLDLFQQEYARLADSDKETLRKMTQIKDASWIPDPESIAEVNKMLKR